MQIAFVVQFIMREAPFEVLNMLVMLIILIIRHFLMLAQKVVNRFNAEQKPQYAYRWESSCRWLGPGASQGQCTPALCGQSTPEDVRRYHRENIDGTDNKSIKTVLIDIRYVNKQELTSFQRKRTEILDFLHFFLDFLHFFDVSDFSDVLLVRQPLKYCVKILSVS